MKYTNVLLIIVVLTLWLAGCGGEPPRREAPPEAQQPQQPTVTPVFTPPPPPATPTEVAQVETESEIEEVVEEDTETEAVELQAAASTETAENVTQDTTTSEQSAETEENVETEAVIEAEIAEENVTTSATAPQPSVLTDWLINTTDERSVNFSASVNVQSVEQVDINGTPFALIRSTGIPNYTTEISQELLNSLNSRPKATSDFTNGQPSIQAGQVINFGDDIGYSAPRGCAAPAEGFGYWPPGPACPTAQNNQLYIPLNPEPATDEVCETQLDIIGLWVNGVLVFNWGDGQSYNNERVWQNTAFDFEAYDLDICPGHSADGKYHHHSYPTCLGEQLGDDGSGPSPIIGYAADGYPIYGPWHDTGVLVESCWKVRNYDDPNSPTGCGVAGERSCQFIDQYDISKGTTPVSIGPRTDAVVESQSRNLIPAVAGTYFEDYHYDAACTAQGEQYLDEHNGHNHDGLGYHYHATRKQNADGTFIDTFPYYIGPEFYGKVHDITQQNGVRCTAGRPGGGGQPSGNQQQGQPQSDQPQGQNQQEGGQPQGGGGQPDFAAAAQILGITEQQLMEALGPPPPDFTAAAEKLGITEQALTEAIQQSAQ